MRGPGPRLLALLAAAGMISCGASIRAVYEGDVRFEHCMALDARPDIKPALRRACWEEWVSFYTFGQTRDRVDYAQLREEQLGGATDVDEGDRPKASSNTVAVAAVAPDPTSAIAPPPMMMASDAGAPDASAPAAEVDERTAALARCTTGCDLGLESCLTRCKRTGPCEVACSARRQRCGDRCDQRRQGSR